MWLARWTSAASSLTDIRMKFFKTLYHCLKVFAFVNFDLFAGTYEARPFRNFIHRLQMQFVHHLAAGCRLFVAYRLRCAAFAFYGFVAPRAPQDVQALDERVDFRLNRFGLRLCHSQLDTVTFYAESDNGHLELGLQHASDVEQNVQRLGTLLVSDAYELAVVVNAHFIESLTLAFLL